MDGLCFYFRCTALKRFIGKFASTLLHRPNNIIMLKFLRINKMNHKSKIYLIEFNQTVLIKKKIKHNVRLAQKIFLRHP